MSYLFQIILILILYTVIESKQSGDFRDDEERRKSINVSFRDDLRDGSSCIRVASLELNRADSSDCRETSRLNLETLKNAASIASKHGVRMLVTPEDGISFGSQAEMLRCIEEIPDPINLDSERSIPCIGSESFKNSVPILAKLSCIARQNNLYLIANYPTRENCVPSEKFFEGICPSRGYFMLNTNVVFDPAGKFIQRYRKYNPFTLTEVFEKAPALELAYFDTEYGRFGLITCFDLLFREPAVELVERYRIDTLIFPTWWFDELPILTALQYQDGWSRAHNVNLISANILRPAIGSIGSAIFSGNHSLNTGANSKNSKLIIANIDKPNSGDCSMYNPRAFDPQIIDISGDSIDDDYSHKNLKILESDSVNILDEGERSLTSCSGQVCCQVDVNFRSKKSTENKLIMIVRDSPRAGFFGWYEQFCVIGTVKNIKENNGHNLSTASDLIFDEEPAFIFQQLNIRLNTTTRHVYPFGAQNVSYLLDRSGRVFSRDELELTNCKLNGGYSSEHKIIGTGAEELAIYSFGIYGRRYDSDEKPRKVKSVPYTDGLRSDL